MLHRGTLGACVPQGLKEPVNYSNGCGVGDSGWAGLVCDPRPEASGHLHLVGWG